VIRTAAIALACGLAACGPDDCEKGYAKLVPLLEAQRHKPLSPEKIESHLALCRAEYVRQNGNPVISCVIAAPDDDAVIACFDKLPNSISGIKLPLRARDAGP
jgi:hypothetical protein